MRGDRTRADFDEQLPELSPVDGRARAPVAQPAAARPASARPARPRRGGPPTPDEIHAGPRPSWLRRALTRLQTQAQRREEQLDQQLEHTRRSGCRHSWTIAFGSQKGGAGKSTAARCTADELALSLRERILVVELDLERGTLLQSVPTAARSEKTLLDVFHDRERIAPAGRARIGNLHPYLSELGWGAQLLRAPYSRQAIRQAASPEVLDAVLELVTQLYPIVLLDLPPGEGIVTPLIEWAFGRVDQLVVVANPLLAAVNQAAEMLADLRLLDPEKPLSLLLNTLPGQDELADPRVVRYAASLADERAFIRLPADSRLTRQCDAAQVDVSQLEQATRIQLKRFALHLANRWTGETAPGPEGRP